MKFLLEQFQNWLRRILRERKIKKCVKIITNHIESISPSTVKVHRFGCLTEYTWKLKGLIIVRDRFIRADLVTVKLLDTGREIAQWVDQSFQYSLLGVHDISCTPEFNLDLIKVSVAQRSEQSL